MSFGTCKLTGSKDRFVKSHILPKALTRLEWAGVPFQQGGSGLVAVRRWDSWYDKRLVTSAGEAILEEYDTWAINYLRSMKLVWSGWGPMTSLGNLHTLTPGATTGLRRIQITQPKMLRLFFLSLLWRAVETTLPEFNDIVIVENDREILKKIIVEKLDAPVWFYPVALIQLSTVGIIHNHTPIRIQVDLPEQSLPVFRFYFDGLIAYVHINASPGNDFFDTPNEVMIGYNETLVVPTVQAEGSLQMKNLLLAIEQTIPRNISNC